MKQFRRSEKKKILTVNIIIGVAELRKRTKAKTSSYGKKFHSDIG